jgi:hypothetical protein
MLLCDRSLEFDTACSALLSFLQFAASIWTTEVYNADLSFGYPQYPQRIVQWLSVTWPMEDQSNGHVCDEPNDAFFVAPPARQIVVRLKARQCVQRVDDIRRDSNGDPCASSFEFGQEPENRFAAPFAPVRTPKARIDIGKRVQTANDHPIVRPKPAISRHDLFDSGGGAFFAKCPPKQITKPGPRG